MTVYIPSSEEIVLMMFDLKELRQITSTDDVVLTVLEQEKVSE